MSNSVQRDYAGNLMETVFSSPFELDSFGNLHVDYAKNLFSDSAIYALSFPGDFPFLSVSIIYRYMRKITMV